MKDADDLFNKMKIIKGISKETYLVIMELNPFKRMPQTQECIAVSKRALTEYKENLHHESHHKISQRKVLPWAQFVFASYYASIFVCSFEAKYIYAFAPYFT